MFHPFRGRFLLLFTAGAMLLGNALRGMSLVYSGHASWGSAALNLAGGCVVSGAFVAAYVVGRPAPEAAPSGLQGEVA